MVWKGQSAGSVKKVLWTTLREWKSMLSSATPKKTKMNHQPSSWSNPLSVIGTSASKQHAIDLQIARFILATNSSFLTVENQHFQQLVQMLRPGTTVPNRKKVSGELLDEIFQTERNKVKTSIQGAIATLAIDGWSTLTNEPVIGICFMSGNECYLANTVNTTGEHHTGDYLLELAKHQIAYVEEEYEVKIRSLVTDNAANMVSIRKQIPELHTYGCHAHIANLLSKDILNHKDFKPVLAKVLTVIKFVRNTHDCSTALKENQMPRPPMPVETRWNSNIDVLCYFVNNWAKLADIINSNARSSENVYRYMEEISLKRAVEDALNFLKPIGVLLDKLQDDTTKLADTFDLWKAVLASSAGLERSFSTLSFTYGKLRSSLGVEKAGKMAFLWKQLNKPWFVWL